MKVYSVLHPKHQVTLAICKTKKLAKMWVKENTKKYKYLKYKIEENEIITNEDAVVNQLQINDVVNNASYDKCDSLLEDSGYGLDYWQLLGIEKGCIFSIWCGDPQGYLYLFDKCMVIPSKCSGEFEFKQVMKFWEENKDKYSDFLEWRKKNLTNHWENGKLWYGGYQKDWMQYERIDVYDIDIIEEDKK